MASNLLLQRLPAAERRDLVAQLDPVELIVGATVVEQGRQVTALLFPLSGCLALQRSIDAHLPLQLGLLGRESCLGASLLLGRAFHTLRVEVLSSGQALCITNVALRPLLGSSPGLRALLSGVLQAQLHQLAMEAVCCRFHALAPRMARWLLERGERGADAQIDATHLTIARLLGVRREAVTSVASAFQRAGVLRYRRGKVEVQDRPRLEELACSCYKRDRWNAQK